jgi:hypothetical protein
MMHQFISRRVHTQKAFISLVIISITLVAALAACGGASPTTSTSSKYGGNIKVGLDADVTARSC